MTDDRSRQQTLRSRGRDRPQPPTLRRTVSRWQVVGLAINDVIGSGVYLLPAAAAALLGPASLGAVGLAGLAVLLIVLCFTEAGSRFDEPGGGYLYTRVAFGELIGFEVGWMTWLARVASVASPSVGFGCACPAGRRFPSPPASSPPVWRRAPTCVA